MSRFGLCGGSYQAESPLADAELAMNLYPEVSGAEGQKSAVQMYNTPGTSVYVDASKFPLTDGPVRAMLELNGFLYIVAGATFFAFGPTSTTTGAVATDNGPASLTPGGNFIFIVSGGASYTFNISTQTFAAVADFATSTTWTVDASGASHGPGLQVAASALANVVTATESGNMVTLILDASIANGSQAGDVIVVAGVGVAGYNGTFLIAQMDASGKVVTYYNSTSGLAASSGGTCTTQRLTLKTNAAPPLTGVTGTMVTISGAANGAYNHDFFCVSGPLRTVIGSPFYRYFCRATVALVTAAPGNDGGATITVNNTPLKGDYCDGYFLRFFANRQTWQISNLNDPTTWNALNISAISIFPDNLVSLIVDHREVWLLGRTKTAVYQDTGASPPLFPFSPVQGAYIEQGCISPFGPVRADNSIFWPGRDERGWLMFWRANGYQPQRVSTHAVEYQWSQYSTVSDMICSSYQEAGHTFIVVSFPTANATWVYDVATGIWHNRGHYNASSPLSQPFAGQDASLAMFHCFWNNVHLVGGLQSNLVYQQSIGIYSDNGATIQRVRQAPVISNEHEYMLHHRLEILLEPGLATFTGGPAIGESQFTLADANGGLWKVQVLDSGLVQVSAGSGNAYPVYFRDSAEAFWQLTVTTGGLLVPIPVAVQPAVFYQSPTNFVTAPSSLQSTMSITTGGLVQTTSGVSPNRGAQITVYWSDDFGKTWSNGRVLDCGQTGAYNQRVITRMLGKSRARIYKLVMSDAAPWRIVDAYVEASPGMTPQPRLSERMRQVA